MRYRRTSILLIFCMKHNTTHPNPCLSHVQTILLFLIVYMQCSVDKTTYWNEALV